MTWINTKDATPIWKKSILVWHDDNGLGEWEVGSGWMDNDIWHIWGFSDYQLDEITYWMYAPEPPVL